jgi:hypothetical protein
MLGLPCCPRRQEWPGYLFVLGVIPARPPFAHTKPRSGARLPVARLCRGLITTKPRVPRHHPQLVLGGPRGVGWGEPLEYAAGCLFCGWRVRWGDSAGTVFPVARMTPADQIHCFHPVFSSISAALWGRSVDRPYVSLRNPHSHASALHARLIKSSPGPAAIANHQI